MSTQDDEETLAVLGQDYDIDGLSHKSRLAEDLQIDRMNLSEEFEKHAVRFAWYSTAYELALDKERRLKSELGRAAAELDSQARAAMTANGVKVTEKKVENMILMTPDYVNLQMEYNEAARMVGLLKAAKDAMIHKKDCLISLGAIIRAELASDPSLLLEMYRKRNQE